MTPKEYRLKKGWTQDEVARKLGLEGENARRTYQRYEDGSRDAPTAIVAAFEQMSRGRVRAADWPQAQPDRIAS